MQSLVTINRIANPNLIYPGQRIVITRGQNNQEMNECKHIVYRVKRGDNLYRIARRYGVSVQSIVRVNRIVNPNLIYPGQLLRICR